MPRKGTPSGDWQTRQLANDNWTRRRARQRGVRRFPVQDRFVAAGTMLARDAHRLQTYLQATRMVIMLEGRRRRR